MLQIFQDFRSFKRRLSPTDILAVLGAQGPERQGRDHGQGSQRQKGVMVKDVAELVDVLKKKGLI